MKKGQKIGFNLERECPCYGWNVRTNSRRYKINTIGTITYVNQPHRYFVVTWGEHNQRTGFKFDDLEKTCFILK